MNWILRSPDRFPEFSRLMESLMEQIQRGVVEPWAPFPPTRADKIRDFRERFRCFRWNLRQYSLHRWAWVERDWVLKTKIAKAPGDVAYIIVYAYPRVTVNSLENVLANATVRKE